MCLLLLFTTAYYWGFHVDSNPECEQLVFNFLYKSEHLQHSAQVKSMWQTQTFQERPQLSNVSPLHVAAHFGMGNVVETLLKAGAEPTATTTWGRTPLHVARTENIVSLLLQSGAHVDCRDIEGETPLMHHSLADSVVVVRKLLQSGADIKATSNAGNAPIHHVSMLRFLLF